jgi:predicted nucleic-acid-binding protein
LIGFDTNVLLRYITYDDPAQARRVDALVERASESGERILINDIDVCEAVWVLRTGYGLGHDTIAEVLDKLFSTAIFMFEDRAVLREALDAYRTDAADFADYVIGLRNARAGCDHTVTFDRALKNCPSFVLLWPAGAGKAHGVPATAALSYQTGSGDEYIRCEIRHQSWVKTSTRDPQQPEHGFTISGSEPASKVAMLCRAYELGDPDGRRLIRTFAALSISKSEGIPTRRYAP